MATTNKGIYYPNDYSNVADVPEDMKKLAESVDTQISNLDTNKVDKVNGKGLSTNDYTNEDKAKLDSLENYDDTEIKQDIEDIQAKDESQDTEIDKQSDLIQKLKDNCINVTTEESTSLQVTDASTLPAKLDIRGNQRQATREGYNIWDYLSAVLSSAGGLTIEKDYENGYITVNGMPSKDYVSIVSTAYITNLLEDGQRYTLWQENYQNEETAGIYLQVARTDDNGTTRYYSLSNSATFLVDKSNNASYSIILQTSTVANTKTLSNYKNRYMLYKGTEDKTYELPGASPSLDYPSEVRAVGDNGSVEIKKINKNWAEIDTSRTVERSGLNIEVDNEGVFTLNGTTTANMYINLINIEEYQNTTLTNYKLPLKKYKAYFDLIQKNNSAVSESNGDASFNIRNFAASSTGEQAISYCVFGGLIKGNTGVQIKDCNITDGRVVAYLYVANGAKLDNFKFRFALYNENETDTTYEKHEEQSYILDIQKPMLLGDYFVKEADGWKEVHTWGYVNTKEINGFDISLNYSNGNFRRYNAFGLVSSRKSGVYLKIFCTHFNTSFIF